MKVFIALVLLVLITLVKGNGSISYVTKYLEVPVDHFSFTNSDTFKLRYLENNTYWKPELGAPIFFYTGNEGDITTFCNNTGFMWEIAPHFNALLVFAEHRYYGVSLPYGNKSFDDKKHSGYLTSSQALADYVKVVDHIKKSYNLPKYKNPVIAFGGSYGGMLAAWIRMKFPSVFAGALAASAPIWQFSGMTPCYAFNRVTTSTYKTTSLNCYNGVKNLWKAINNITLTAEGREWLGKTFKTCKPLSNETDIDKLKEWVKDVLTNMAMVNYPYPANFLADLPANPVKVFCKSFKSSYHTTKELLQDLHQGLSIYFNRTGKAKCLNVDENSNPEISDKGWDYQTCMEMVMPFCDDGENDMFEKQKWNFTTYSGYCQKKYGLSPQEYYIEKMYGGKNIKAASNIIFSNGLLDPWSSGGVLFNISKTLVAVLMPEAAHHLDLRFTNINDPLSVLVARKFHKQHIKKWITEYNIKGSNLLYESLDV